MRCNLALVKLENVRSLPTLGINCNPRWQGMANATFITFRDLASELNEFMFTCLLKSEAAMSR